MSRSKSEAGLSTIARLKAERDEWKKRFETEQQANAYGCPECRNHGGTPPHSEDAIEERKRREPGWEFYAKRDCPNGYSQSIGDTGDYEWVCGCELVPCTDKFCIHGVRLRELNAIRAELAAALTRAETAEREHRVALASISALESVLDQFARIRIQDDNQPGTWGSSTIYCEGRVKISSVRLARSLLPGRKYGGKE